MQEHAPNVHANDLAIIDDDVLKSLYQRSSHLGFAVARDRLHSLEQILPNEVNIDLRLLPLLRQVTRPNAARAGRLQRASYQLCIIVRHIHKHAHCDEIGVYVLVILLSKYLDAFENGDEVLLAEELNVVVDDQLQAFEAVLDDLLLQFVGLSR